MKPATDKTLTRAACLSASALSLILTSCGSNDDTGYIAPPAATPMAQDVGLIADAAAEPEAAAVVLEPFTLHEGEKLVKYRIKKGDSLEKIGKAFGTTPSRIRSANEMDSDMIYYGRSLKVPTTKEVVAAQAPVQAAPAQAPVTAVRPVAPTPAPVAPKPAPPVAPAPKLAAPQIQLTPPQPIAPPVPQQAPAPAPAPSPTGVTTGPATGGLQISD